MNKLKALYSKVLHILPLIFIIYFGIIEVLFFTKTYSNYRTFIYLITIACTIFSLFYVFESKDSKIVTLAFLMISISDLLLIFMIQYRVIALITFSIAQLLFGYRFSKTIATIPFKINAITRILIILVGELIGVIILKENFDITIALTLFYFANLIANFIFSIITIKVDKKNYIRYLLPVGFFCFMLCDIYVGLSASDGYLNIQEGTIIYHLLHIDLGGDWLFYIPTLFILAYSTRITILNRQKDIDI